MTTLPAPSAPRALDQEHTTQLWAGSEMRGVPLARRSGGGARGTDVLPAVDDLGDTVIRVPAVRAPAPTARAARAPRPDAEPDPAATLVRLALHLTLAGLPLLAISAHVFELIPMHLTAALVVLPLVVAVGVLGLADPLPVERLVLRGALWGALATAVYDLVRLDTVYLLRWWGDFIPTMGTWVLGAGPDAVGAGAVVGYVWRYAGDGAGIGVVFFVLVAATGLRRLGRRRLVAAATAFAVFPVWSGLVATVAIAPRGQQAMFPLTPVTIGLSLLGHLIFGVVLGLGCARCTDLERDWPWPPLLGPAALRRPGGLFPERPPEKHPPAKPPPDGEPRWLVPPRDLPAPRRPPEQVRWGPGVGAVSRPRPGGW